MQMPDATMSDDSRPHKVWADAEGTIHKCEWFKVGDRKVPLAVTLCGLEPPPQAMRMEVWDVTCAECNEEVAARRERLVQGSG
jgi:formylmethanofuran dehydrogenase subunit E